MGADPMSTGSSTPLFAPIAAPVESLPQTLPALLDDVWRRIAAGLNGRWPPWALPMLATLSPHGPRARVLALRSVDPAERLFVFHTDARSDTVRELRADGRVSVDFWAWPGKCAAPLRVATKLPADWLRAGLCRRSFTVHGSGSTPIRSGSPTARGDGRSLG